MQCGQIGIDFKSNAFSLAPEHIIHFNSDDDIMKQLNRLCIRTTDQKVASLHNTTSSTLFSHYMTPNVDDAVEMSISPTDDYNQLQRKQLSAVISGDIHSNKHDQINTLQEGVVSTEES